MLNPSDIVVRPTDLTERPAPKGSAGASPLPEPTPTTMAERFAPTAQKLPADGPAPPLVDPALMPRLIAERARASSAGKWLLIAAILVSLVPTAVILVLLWQGVIAIPRSGDVQSRADPEPLAATQQATVAPAPAVLLGAKPEIALTVPGQIAAKSGDEIAFTISIDSDETLPARSVIAIRALPEGAIFSQGRPYGTAEWNLTPDEIGDLKLKLPETASGGADMRVELMAADGAILASALTRLDIAPDPRADLILRSDESGRIADLIALGHKMIDVGYFAGARAYFKRAAEAGSGDAALLLGATFDPEFIAKIGAQGIKADPKRRVAGMSAPSSSASRMPSPSSRRSRRTSPTVSNRFRRRKHPRPPPSRRLALRRTSRRLTLRRTSRLPRRRKRPSGRGLRKRPYLRPKPRHRFPPTRTNGSSSSATPMFAPRPHPPRRH